jgi:prepilin-type N-terminal cleavage/methylation domain-containing protein
MLGMKHLNSEPKKNSRRRINDSGFTIIELLIATVVFSIVLLVILTAFIRTSDLFYKGVSMNNTQEAARNITESIENDIKFSNSPPQDFDVTNSTQGQFCIGLHRYRYQMGHQLNGASGDYVMARDTVGSANCPDTSTTPVDKNTLEELAGPGMQMNHLQMNCSGGSRCIVSVHLIFYGGSPADADELFYSPKNLSPTHTAADAQCTGTLSSSQICATADFSRTVLINS